MKFNLFQYKKGEIKRHLTEPILHKQAFLRPEQAMFMGFMKNA